MKKYNEKTLTTHLAVQVITVDTSSSPSDHFKVILPVINIEKISHK
jgi:hypothetical protein